MFRGDEMDETADDEPAVVDEVVCTREMFNSMHLLKPELRISDGTNPGSAPRLLTSSRRNERRHNLDNFDARSTTLSVDSIARHLI